MKLERLSDEELLVSARTVPRAFGIFYERHVGAVDSYFRRRVRNVEMAFDLTAETFAAALQSVPRYESGPAPARAWLFGVARNTLLASLRSGQVEDRARRALAMEPLVLDDADVLLLRDVIETPALEAVKDLPPEQRSAVMAHHVCDESYGDIAQRLECSESVVRQRVSRGLRTLRTRLRENSDG